MELPAPSSDWCLFLDVDGTLIDFTDSPLGTYADNELKALLSEVAVKLGGCLALVSGRSIRYLDALFAPLRLPSAGLHGIERRGVLGETHGASFVDEQLDGARAAMSAFVAAHPGTSLEDKGRTVAVHFRTAPHLESRIRQVMRGIAAPLGDDYHIQEGNMVLEIKPSRFTKATAIAAFLQEQPFSNRTPVFVGDDITDLDGFRVVEDRGGISIAVGDKVRAQRRLNSPAAVREWLRRIASLAHGQK
jgi:trehalose 6-phosphate phosphatase